ncbi:hypothetical protein D0T92_00605 [Neisseria zalophi]|uniref:Uncharacterized protein n=1 Tax=Neisseria zalophi TaxID=640030 RepID=A0A5J6PWH3_9NEIS|nr:hypothetical protein D0T92_00605 [Neisseria zalophi]
MLEILIGIISIKTDTDYIFNQGFYLMGKAVLLRHCISSGYRPSEKRIKGCALGARGLVYLKQIVF